jgi:hypothetical protein
VTAPHASDSSSSRRRPHLPASPAETWRTPGVSILALVEDLEADARARGGQRDFDHSLTVDEGTRDELAHGKLERWGLLSQTLRAQRGPDQATRLADLDGVSAEAADHVTFRCILSFRAHSGPRHSGWRCWTTFSPF